MLGYHPPRDHAPYRDHAHPPTLGAEHAGRYGQRAGGTHPTGMQSCVEFLLFSCKRLCTVAFSICSQFFERPFPIFISKAGYRTAYLQN